jgi:lysyl-tRNA synthetase class 1
MVDGKKMSASVGNVVYPDEWLKVSNPETLRLLFLKDPMRVRDFKWELIPRLEEELLNLEKIYYGEKKPKNEREKINLITLFKLVQTKKLPEKILFKVPYDFVCMLVQITPEDGMVDRITRMLEKTYKRKFTEEEKLILKQTIEKAHEWVKNYAPENMKIKILEKLTDDAKNKLSPKQIEALKRLSEFISDTVSDDEIKSKISSIAEELKIPPQQIFEAAYLVLLGKEFGPRLIPFIQSLDKSFVRKRFSELT